MDLPLPPDEVTARVRAHLDKGHPTVRGTAHRRNILLNIQEDHRHFWSPTLDIHLDDGKTGGTRLAAMFAPSPNIWSSFLAVQFFFGLCSIGALMYLTSSWMLGRDLMVPAGILFLMLFGGGFSFGAAYVGQGFGSEQMYELRAFLDAALEVPAPPAPSLDQQV